MARLVLTLQGCQSVPVVLVVLLVLQVPELLGPRRDQADLLTLADRPDPQVLGPPRLPAHRDHQQYPEVLRGLVLLKYFI